MFPSGVDSQCRLFWLNTPFLPRLVSTRPLTRSSCLVRLDPVNPLPILSPEDGLVVVLSKEDVVELLSWTYTSVVAAPLVDRMLSGVLYPDACQLCQDCQRGLF